MSRGVDGDVAAPVVTVLVGAKSWRATHWAALVVICTIAVKLALAGSPDTAKRAEYLLGGAPAQGLGRVGVSASGAELVLAGS